MDSPVDDLLLEEIAGSAGERHLVLDPELVVRAGSVAGERLPDVTVRSE